MNQDRRWLSLPRLAVAALLIVAFLAGALAFGRPFGGGGGGVTVAAASPCASAAECAITVKFVGRIDHAQIERTLQIDPPVSAVLTWQGDTLLIRPTQKLEPATTYTVGLRSPDSPPLALSPFVRFVANGTSAPVTVTSFGAETASTLEPSATTGGGTPTQAAATAILPTATSDLPPTAIPTATAVEVAPLIPTAVPTVVPTVAPTPSPVPTAVATPRPTSAPPSPVATSTALGGCSVQPVRGFSLVYHMTPALMVRIGCALGAEQSISAQSAPFERGTMLWRGDTRQIFVLRRDGSWVVFPDTWQPTDVLPDAGAPPAGKFAPIGRLGKLWRQPDVRAALGWETAAEIPVVGAVEEFAHGRMLWTSDRLIYVLYTDGTWQSFPDTFVDQP